MGLEAPSNSNVTYLSIAGGFIWDRKQGEDHPNYDTQTFTRADKTEGVRSGAKYAALTGMIVGVAFRTHDEYGESINITIDTSDNSRYIVSVSTNNRYSQELMKALLVADLTKPLYMRPFDFEGRDKKNVRGITFKQGGQKLDLKTVEYPDEFQKDREWFGTAKKKEIKRFFEDLSEWFVGEVEEKVCSQLDDLPPLEEPSNGLGAATSKVSKPEDDEESEPQAKQESKPKSEEKPKMTPVKMRRALKEYIKENYPDKDLPKLEKSELVEWYELSLEGEELPFEEEEDSKGAMSDEALDAELEKLV